MSAYKSSDENYSTLVGEFNIIKCKLESKSEAVLILSKELEQCRSERDQFKLMANQLRERYSALKRRIEGWGPSLMGVYDVQGLKGQQEQSLALMLCELKEKNKTLQSEVDEYKQKMQEALGDIKILREQQARHKDESVCDLEKTVLIGPLIQREDMVSQLESIKSKYILLERDLQSLLDEKEELVMARDAYKNKVERLNQRLNNLLKGDQHRILDIDSILMDNRYLQECLKQHEEEISMLKSSISKYKTLLEKKRGGRNNFRITTASGTYFLSVQQILQNNPLLELPNNPSSATDLRNLVVTLFESLGDKSLALSHQRKTNKILANRITELERKMKAAEESKIAIDTKIIPGNVEEAEDESFASKPRQSTAQQDPALKPLLENRVLPGDELHSEEHTDLDLLPTRERNSFDVRSKSDCLCSYRESFSDSELGSLLSTPVSSQSPFHLNNAVEMVGETNEKSLDLSRCRISVSSEDDDLPPQLQKLLAIALMDLENRECNGDSPSSSTFTTPNHNARNEELET